MSSNEERTFARLLDEQRAQNNPASSVNTASETDWNTKLSGKKIVDGQSLSANTFSKRDLPEKHRVLPPGAIVTKDYHHDRLNVHVDEQGNTTHVTYG